MAVGHNSGNAGAISGDQLRSLIERIERLSAEKATITADIREVFAEVKGSGFDAGIMRKIIAERKRDANDLDEERAVLELYRRALGMLANTPLGEAALERAAG